MVELDVLRERDDFRDRVSPVNFASSLAAGISRASKKPESCEVVELRRVREPLVSEEMSDRYEVDFVSSKSGTVECRWLKFGRLKGLLKLISGMK